MCVSITLAQKKLIIYNYSVNTITISNIFTKKSNNTSSVFTYPYFMTQPNIVIPANTGTYTLVNTANVNRFPLNSPSSIPYINNWFNVTSATTSTNLTSLAAWNTFSNFQQVFNFVKFYVISNTGVGLGGGNIGELPFGSVSLSGYLNSWNCIYEKIFPDPINQPNLVEYTIVFY